MYGIEFIDLDSAGNTLPLDVAYRIYSVQEKRMPGKYIAMLTDNDRLRIRDDHDELRTLRNKEIIPIQQKLTEIFIEEWGGKKEQLTVKLLETRNPESFIDSDKEGFMLPVVFMLNLSLIMFVYHGVKKIVYEKESKLKETMKVGGSNAQQSRQVEAGYRLFHGAKGTFASKRPRTYLLVCIII